jgi:PAP2 superfamily
MNRSASQGIAALLFCAIFAQAVHAAEPLTSGQRHVQTAGSILQLGIPLGALALTWMLDPQPGVSGDEAGHSKLLLMGGTPRHDLLLAVGRTWVVTAGLKYSIDETRPNGEAHSFPSGHASIAFTGAEFIRKEYGWHWAAPAYVAAGFVGWSRVESKKHYTHDVVAGAALGILANHDFWLRHDGGAIRISAATFESGRALAPGLRLDWIR